MGLAGFSTERRAFGVVLVNFHCCPFAAKALSGFARYI